MRAPDADGTLDADLAASVGEVDVGQDEDGDRCHHQRDHPHDVVDQLNVSIWSWIEAVSPGNASSRRAQGLDRLVQPRRETRRERPTKIRECRARAGMPTGASALVGLSCSFGLDPLASDALPAGRDSLLDPDRPSRRSTPPVGRLGERARGATLASVPSATLPTPLPTAAAADSSRSPAFARSAAASVSPLRDFRRRGVRGRRTGYLAASARSSASALSAAQSPGRRARAGGRQHGRGLGRILDLLGRLARGGRGLARTAARGRRGCGAGPRRRRPPVLGRRQLSAASASRSALPASERALVRIRRAPPARSSPLVARSRLLTASRAAPSSSAEVPSASTSASCRPCPVRRSGRRWR